MAKPVWRLLNKAQRDMIQGLCPLAPLPWGTRPDRPWCIVDANGEDVVLTTCAGDAPRAMQTLGVIISAVNTFGGYKVEK